VQAGLHVKALYIYVIFVRTSDRIILCYLIVVLLRLLLLFKINAILYNILYYKCTVLSINTWSNVKQNMEQRYMITKAQREYVT